MELLIGGDEVSVDIKLDIDELIVLEAIHAIVLSSCIVCLTQGHGCLSSWVNVKKPKLFNVFFDDLIRKFSIDTKKVLNLETLDIDWCESEAGSTIMDMLDVVKDWDEVSIIRKHHNVSFGELKWQ
jgi:hypothetical protein